MKTRREILYSFIGFVAIAGVSDATNAKGKNKKKAKTCSAKRDEVLKRKCSKTQDGLSPAQCKSKAEVRFQKCLQTGSWEGKKGTVQLEKR